MQIFAVLCVAMCAAAAASSQCEGETLRLVNDLRKEFEEKLQMKEEDLTLLFNEKLLDVEAKLQKEIRKQHDQDKEDTTLLKRDDATNDSDLEIRVGTLEEEVDELENYIFLINSQLTATQTQVAAVISNLAVVQEQVSETRIEVLEQTVHRLDDEIKNTSLIIDKVEEEVNDVERRVDDIGDIEAKEERYAFMASLTNDAPSDYVEFDRVLYNRRWVYNPYNGVFTAPIDGIYHLSTQMWIDDCTGWMRVYFYVNGATAYYAEYENPSGNNGLTATAVADLQLSARDQVRVYASGAIIVHGTPGEPIVSSFSGHLIQAL